jgi:flagellar hook-associated protein 1 FlgK
MSLNSIISTSLSGLFTNQTALRTTANNVANVNTEGYSRVRVVQETAITQGTSAGVSISSIERVVDEFLETALRTSESNTAEFTAQREFHDRLQGILGDPSADSSLSSRIDQVFSAIADLSLSPADVLRRTQTLSEMQSFLDQTSLFGEQIQTLRSEASQQMVESVDAINEQLQRIHDINPLLAKQTISGEESGGLEGQLAQALSGLADLIDIKVDRQETGSVYVSTSNGYPLIDTSLSQLEYDAPGVVLAGTYFPTVNISRVDDDTLEASSSTVDLTPHIRSGRLAGLIEMRDEQLPNLSLALGELGARVADEFNAVHNSYSASPAANSLEGRQTFVDGSHDPGFTGIVTFAVVDSSNQLVASSTVDFDSASPADFDALVTAVNGDLGANGTLALTNGVFSFSATNSTDGVVIADDASAPSDRGGRGFSHFFGMNDLIVADQPGIYDTGITGAETHNMTAGETIEFRVVDSSSKELETVTVTVPAGTDFDDMLSELNSVTGLGAYFTFAWDSNGALGWTENSGYDGAQLSVVADNTQVASTGMAFTEVFGVGDVYVADAARNMEIREEIVDDPDLMALSVFDTTGSIGDVVLTSGDQRGALALQDLHTSLVNFDEAGELKETDVTLTQYVARFLGNAGLQAVRAANFEEDNMALQEEIGARNSDISGVNLDEELSNLVVYQNAYNAAARILSSVQELYDSLLAAV